MATSTAGNQSSSQQPSAPSPLHNPPLIIFTPSNSNGGSIPRLPAVPRRMNTHTKALMSPNQLAITNQSLLGAANPISTFKSRIVMNPDVLGDSLFWASKRENLSDEERARVEGIDEVLKPLDDLAWYYWPTWTQAIESGRHGTEEELHASLPGIRWTNDFPMDEIYPPPAPEIQNAIKKHYPLKFNYYVTFVDRPLNDLKFIVNHSCLGLVHLVGESDGSTSLGRGKYQRIYDRCPKRGEAYRHIMFPINNWSWLLEIPYIFSEIHLGGVMDHPPLKASIDQGYFNSFLKPAIECQPSVGKVSKLTVSVPILCIKKGRELMEKKLSEKVLHHHPHFLRAPGYEYAGKYIGDDGKREWKPPIWTWATALDGGFNLSESYKQHDHHPTIWSGRSLFEYHHPKMDTLFLDLRQTMRRGNRGDWADDEFLMVEQLWAVIVPEKETLITFQSIKGGWIPGKVGGFNVHDYEPGKGTEIVPQGPVHDFFLFFADLVLRPHYRILDVFRSGTAFLNFRVADEVTRDSKLIEDCNTIISELSIILEVTKKQIEILYGVETVLIKDSLRPEEYDAALGFYKFLSDRMDVVVSAFADIQAEAKQAQTLLFQLLNSEAAKQQARMATQQALIAEQTAQETAIQLELSKRASEQNKSFLVFTIITTIFLPLSFFTSYFGMNTRDIRDMESTQFDFWAIAGPVSAIIILIAMCWAFRMKLGRGMRVVFSRYYKGKGIEKDIENDGSILEKGMGTGQRQKNPWHHFGKYRSEKKD